MPATRDDINSWLDRLYADQQITHMIVFCDTFDSSGDCCYPVYVEQGQDVRAVAAGGDRLMEVYSARYSREHQLAAGRAFNYD